MQGGASGQTVGAALHGALRGVIRQSGHAAGQLLIVRRGQPRRQELQGGAEANGHN